MSDTITGYKGYRGVPEAVGDMASWVVRAAPGAWARYRLDEGKTYDFYEWSRLVAPAMQEAYTLYAAGLVELFQRRTPWGLEYLAQRRRGK